MMRIIAYAPADKATYAPPMRKLCVLMLMFGAPGIAMLRNDATKRHLDKAHYREPKWISFAGFQIDVHHRIITVE